MVDLASSDDVAHALGLANAAALSTSQGLRVGALLVQVSRWFRREAEREFSPGTTTLRFLTVAGTIHLPDPVTDVDDVTSATMLDQHGDEVELTYTLDGQELRLEYDGCLLPSGVEVTVTYEHTAAPPADVTAAVAAIVARHLTVDPLGPESQSTELSTDSYRQRFADWVSQRGLLTEEECAEARSYRYPGTAIIIQKP